mmetsp:Transcript_10437/g.13042  ORF Transcript_10437/g.13042 Transcript_10437/m.13042 type:complete len:428 (+) Transcript_10437:35-1318(+)
MFLARASANIGTRARVLNQTRSSLRCFSTRYDHDLFNPSDEHRILRSQVRDFAENEVEPQAKEFNRNEKFNIDLYRKVGELGLLGLTVDPEYGGAGADAVSSCIVHEELSAVDPAFCLSYLAHSLLFTNNLNFNGNQEQKERFLPDACSGKRIGGMCMSEPAYGTDVLGMQTTAVKNNKGGYTLNGQKMWITNGCVDDDTLGDMFLVYARTATEDTPASRSISLFLVEKGMDGFSLGTRIKDKCGMRASATAELVFEDVHVPAENLVGEEGGAVLCMMRNLEIERVALGAMSCGIARRSVEMMNAYANERKAFSQPLVNFGQIQRYIANSYAEFMAGRTYLYNVAANMELEHAGNRLETDAVKLFCTEMGKNVADNAIQVLGGNGYIGDYVVERLWRDSKLLEIGGGTLESHQKNMVRDLKSLNKID